MEMGAEGGFWGKYLIMSRLCSFTRDVVFRVALALVVMIMFY